MLPPAQIQIQSYKVLVQPVAVLVLSSNSSTAISDVCGRGFSIICSRLVGCSIGQVGRVARYRPRRPHRLAREFDDQFILRGDVLAKLGRSQLSLRLRNYVLVWKFCISSGLQSYCENTMT